MPLQIEQHKDNKCLVLVIRGSFGAVEDAKSVRVAVSEALAKGQILILVNVTEVGQLDDFGAETLLACAFMTRHRGGLLQIFGAATEVKAMLTGLSADGLLVDADGEDSAIAELCNQAQRDGIESKPFDILEFVREEEGRGEELSEEPKPSEK